MSPKNEPELKVTDRRLFNAEGELRPDVVDEERRQETAPSPPLPAAETTPAANAAPAAPPPISAEEHQASHSAFRDAGAKVDDILREALGNQHHPEKLQVSFESLVASMYMTAMMQLGMLHEKGEQPQVDLVGARHTIDTLSMLEEKTRGNLTEGERAVLQDALFRLRMAFVEITNMLTRQPAPGEPTVGQR
ncbi:MAG TPA: DUF1844 domain-containing protein [Terriglobales bacterium]|nr:DUF1844 domain-containing protein [Terriglobales bacterium]